MPTPVITLSAAKGVSSILYADAFNFVHTAYSTAPVLRIQKQGDTSKIYEPLGAPVISTTTNPNDTMTMSSANVTMKVVVVTVADGYGFQVSFPVFAYTQAIVDWDLLLYTARFESQIPTWDGTTKWGNGNQGWDPNAALELVFDDQVAPTNPWQVWCSTFGPINVHWAPKNYTSTTPGWQLYITGSTGQAGYYCEFPLAAGFSCDVNVLFSAVKPDPTVVAPSAFTIQSNRWPVITRRDLFPPKSLFGLNIFCQSATPGTPNPVQNPNGWNGATTTFNLYDPAGSGKLVAEMTGDESGLVALANWIVGRIRWCNHVTYVVCGGVSVIHWDLWDGEEYPQSGTSYVGDPRISRTQCRELWYRSATFPVPIIQQALDNLKWAYNPANPPQPIFCPNLMPGCALRASHWPSPAMYTNPAPTQYSWQSGPDAVSDLSAKIDRIYWAGFRVFYVDSWGSTLHPQAYTVDDLRTMMQLYPDILLCPESYDRQDMYSAGYPFRDKFPSLDSDPQANQIWPGNAHCLMRMENGSGVRMDPGVGLLPPPQNAPYLNAVRILQRAHDGGDCPLANCYSGVKQLDGTSPTELEQVNTIWKTLH